MRTVVSSLAAFLLITTAANAIPVSGTTTFSTSGTTGVVAVTNLLPTFSLNLAVGGSQTVNALSLTPAPGAGTTQQPLVFSVTDTISFVLPGTGSEVDVGSGTISVQGNTINQGALTFADGANGANITLAGGYVVNVNLSDVSFVGDSARGGDTQTVTATFRLVSGPTSVPEPASLTIIGGSLVGLGLLRKFQAARRR